MVRPYTLAELRDGLPIPTEAHPQSILERVRATVEALERAPIDAALREASLLARAEKAESERDALYAALSESGISHGGTVEGLRQGLEVVATLRAERDDIMGVTEKYQHERDEAQKWVAAQQSVVADVLRERDEARADLTTLVREAREDCAMKQQEARAENAALREALEAVRQYVHGDETLRAAEAKMEAALATDAGQAWLREFARRVVETAFARHDAIMSVEEIVEEVLRGKA